jgi:hypothetical protein
MQNFIKQILDEYNIDITKNITIKDKLTILQNDNKFNFFNIFIRDFQKSGLHTKENFIAIGTSEDNNIYITKKYYDILFPYYVYTHTDDTIFLCKR